ncbi:succinylglutamate desuccinylase/aspartoacylase family protein [Euzebya tangerina]|uniref:succinylglutamate desuccinylase/aspartoacylase family protein n=1 Tax=Euzebya tangerina TaxID=591198 RepID=UPI0013C2FB30|nr:succinylglutamate desuccinylase/aspartoacylase family protein [Euzebya tangerina]
MTTSKPALFHRLEGRQAIADLLAGRTDTDVLEVLDGRPALLHLEGDEPGPHRLISVLLHGNEDSGYRALLDWLRSGGRSLRPLWLFIGNVRAATQNGWFGDRFLDDQEDFNRVWGIEPATTRMRICAAQVLDIITAQPLEGAIDIHNNTGDNPMYAIIPDPTAATRSLAALISRIGLIWGTQDNTLMQALEGVCPAVAVECGRAGVAAHVSWARRAIEVFMQAEELRPPDTSGDGWSGPMGEGQRLLEVRFRVEVRREVAFEFAQELSEAHDLSITPGLDAANFGRLHAGTRVGITVPGGDIPFVVLDDTGVDCAPAFLQVDGEGSITLTRDVIPAMMTRSAEQTRRDCLFYIVADLGGTAGEPEPRLPL